MNIYICAYTIHMIEIATARYPSRPLVLNTTSSRKDILFPGQKDRDNPCDRKSSTIFFYFFLWYFYFI